MPEKDFRTQNVSRGTLPPAKGIRKPGAGKANPERVQTKTRIPQSQPNTVKNKKINEPVKNVKRVKRKKVKNRSKVPYILLFTIFLICVIFFSSFLSYTYLVDKYQNPTSIEGIYIDPDTVVKFKIEKGSSTKNIAENLKELELIKNMDIYRFLSKFNGYDGQYKAGTYTLSKGLTYDEIMVILSSNPESVKVTFPEGFTTDQIAARLEANGVCKASDFIKAVDVIDVSSYAFIPESEGRDYRLDGYLFPDTYEFDIDADVNTVIYKMLNRFNEIFKPSYYSKAQTLDLSVDEVIVLASIIEKEVKLASERKTVSGVFYNRLQSSEPSMAYMQSCATVRYAYKKVYNETIEGDITEEHEKVVHPYNTYMYKGLTPGPICSPGAASIEAALNPENHQYLFFVLRKDGSGGHIFSKTYEEHLKAKNG